MATYGAHILYLNDIAHIPNPSHPNNPDRPGVRYKILAEGDSWFTVGGLPIDNVLKNLEFDDENAIVSLAKPGDTLKNMMDICNNKNWQKLTSKQFGYKWNALLFSAGGNDVIDYAPNLVLTAEQRGGKPINGPEDYFHDENVQTLMNHIEDGYAKLVEWRDRADSICRGVPIIAHTYDWATPIDVAAEFLAGKFGPWLYPVFKKAQMPESDFIAASDYLLGRFGDTLLGLNLPNVHVVKTTGTLVRAALGATGKSNDWLNEIHPTHDGYRKIAPKISRKIKELVNP